MTATFRRSARAGIERAPRLSLIRQPLLRTFPEYLWKLEQPAHAVANGYFVGAINRVGHEMPWDIGGNFMARATFANRAPEKKSLPRRRATKTRSSLRS